MKRLILTALLLFAVAIGVSATTVVPISVETMTQRASRVVLAEALDSHAEWENGTLYTYTRFRVIQSYKGEEQREVVVRQAGGVKDGKAVQVVGVRNFKPGRQTVLFLRPAKTGAAYSVVGLMQGRFEVTRSATGEMRVSNGLSHVKAYRDGHIEDMPVREMSLGELRARIQKAVGR